MNGDLSKTHAHSFVTAPRWLTPRVLVLFALVLGTAVLALARVEATPGVLATAAMIFAVWWPILLKLDRLWLRRLWIAWAAPISLFYLAWWVWYAWRLPLPEGLGSDFFVGEVGPAYGLTHDLATWIHIVPYTVGVGMAGVLGSLLVVRRALRREIEAPSTDSSEQIIVLAGAWLALAGGMATVDALRRPDMVLQHENTPWCRDASKPMGPRAAICQEGPSQIEPEEYRSDRCFCRDLTHPWVNRRAAACCVMVSGIGVLVALLAARRSRRRATWLEQVGDRAVDGWSIARYTPEHGALEAIPRLVGGAEAGSAALTCLVIHKLPPLAQPPANAAPTDGYREAPTPEGDTAPRELVVGRLNGPPRGGGLKEARRGEDDVRQLGHLWRRILALMFVVDFGFKVFCFGRDILFNR